MTAEIAMYAFGALLIPAVGWAIALQIQLLMMSWSIKELLDMHKQPDNTGFGTRKLETFVTSNTIALDKLAAAIDRQTAYMKGRDAGFKDATDHG